MLELMARIKSVLSRSQTYTPDNGSGIINIGGREIDTFGLTVTVDGVKSELTAKEYAVLMLFVNNIGAVLSRDRILNEVWGYDSFGVDRTVDWQIKLLRSKLGPFRDCIKSVRGVGYKFEA